MKMLASLAILLINGLAYAGPGQVDLKYKGFSFGIPAGAEAVGSNGGQDNFLVFRYGKEKGKQYLAFTDMSADRFSGKACTAAEFVTAAFGGTATEVCPEADVVTFRNAFSVGVEPITWKINKAVAYYVSLPNGQFVFMVSGDNRVLKVESDFLTKSELKSMVLNSVK